MKLDNTAYACLDRCQQEYVFRHVRHLVPTTLDAAAHFGTIVHRGVRALYDAQGLPAAFAYMEDMWREGMEAHFAESTLRNTLVTICASCGGSQCGPLCHESSQVPVLDHTRPWYSLWRARGLVMLYEAQWLKGVPMFEVVWNEGYAESATECALPDRCVRSLADGQLYAMDLKTTGMYVTREWQRSFEHSRQVAIQLDVLEHTLKERVAGFWLDTVHVSRSVPKAQDFSRYGPLLYSDALRAELRQQRVWKAARANDLAYAPQSALKNEDACVRYNHLCPYFDVCHADPIEREAFVQIRLAKGTWKEEVWQPKLRV